MRIREAFVAGVMKPYNIVGNYFRLQEATGMTPGSVTVEFFSASRKLNIDLGGTDPGDFARAYPDGFDRVEIVSTVSETLAFQVLRGEVGSDRITGTVAIVEGGVTRTLSGVAFWGAAGPQPVAAQYSHAQLWNLPGSGKNLIVNKIFVSTLTTQGVSVGRNAVALANLSMAGQAKVLGGAASIAAQLRSENNVGLLVTAVQAYYMAASVPVPLPLVEPIIIPPGVGLVVAGQTVNTALNANCDFWEQPV